MPIIECCKLHPKQGQPDEIPTDYLTFDTKEHRAYATSRVIAVIRCPEMGSHVYL